MRWGLRILLGLVLWGCSVPGVGSTLTLTWINPTTFLDGSPALPADIGSLKVYRNLNSGSFSLYQTLPGTSTTTTDLAPGVGINGYYVTAVSTTGLESGGSAMIFQVWPVTAGVPVLLSWDGPAPPDAGVTVNGFQVQVCTVPTCASACSPVDLPGGQVGPTIFTFTDGAVFPGLTYRYQLVTTGTIQGGAARSVPTAQVCTYVRAQRRGHPVIFPPTQ